MDDLGLEIRTRGRRAVPVDVAVARELEPADLALLELDRGSKPPPLARIRDSHHALARALAAGMKPAEASLVTGFSPSRISILQNDPSFQELLEFYRENLDAVYADLHRRLATLSLDAASELQERLEQHPEDLGTGQLLKLLEMTADRTGAAPPRGTVNVNVNVGLAERMEAAKERLARAKVIEALPGPAK